MEFTDLHSHIAWGIDDGIPDYDHACKALQMAEEDGIFRILSTPHIIPGQTSKEEYAQIRSRQQELKELAGKSGIEIYSGGEVMLNNHLLETMQEGWLPEIHHGPYMLVEFNVRHDYADLSFDYDPLYELKIRGIHPVVAHVERYFHKGLDYEVIDEWKNEGYVFQINATSLLGLDTPQAKKNAWELLKKGYAHVISTDTHRTEGSRIENLSAAYHQVEKKLGSEAAQLLFSDNANAVIAGKPVADLPKPARRFGFFGRS